MNRSDERARLMHEAGGSFLWHRAATGRVDMRRTIPKETAADIEPMTLSPQLVHNS
jgi:hypothetical protein